MAKVLSVVIPTFNRAQWVLKCVDSVLQSGVADVEVLVVDDGSSDDTKRVVATYHPSVCYLKQANSGPAVARNYGASMSRGQYLMFLDDDDSLKRGAVERLVKALDECHEFAGMYGDTDIGNDATGYASFLETFGGSDIFELERRDYQVGVWEFDRDSFFRRFIRRNTLFLGSFVFRRQAFERAGGFDPRLRGAADYELFLRFFMRNRIAFSPGPSISTYLKHDAAMTMDYDHMDEDVARALSSVLKKMEMSQGDRELLRHRLREHRFGWAYKAVVEGRGAEARRRLAWMYRDGDHVGLRELKCWMISLMPGVAYRASRWLRAKVVSS